MDALSAGPKTREQLVRRDPGVVGDPLDGQYRVARPPDQRDGIADGALQGCYINHRHVHRYSSRDGSQCTTYEYRSHIAECARISVSVPNSQRRDARRPIDAKSGIVAHAIPRLQFSNLNNWSA